MLTKRVKAKIIGEHKKHEKDTGSAAVQTGVLSRDGVLDLLETLPDGTTELMCHPGYVDDDLVASATRLQASRETELAILTDTAVRKSVASHGIRLINYSQIAN